MINFKWQETKIYLQILHIGFNCEVYAYECFGKHIVVLISVKRHKMKTGIFRNINKRIKCVLITLLLFAIVIYALEVNDLFDRQYITKTR